MNSVDGTMTNAGLDDFDDTQINNNLKDPAWKKRAEQAISILLPENVSISSSKVISALPETGVIVVCELSNGSAYSVRLTGQNKEARAYVFFPDGYDGSLDFNPARDKSVG